MVLEPDAPDDAGALACIAADSAVHRIAGQAVPRVMPEAGAAMDEDSHPSSPTPWWRQRRDADAYEHAKRWLQRPMTVLSLIFTAGLLIGATRELEPWARTGIAVINGLIWVAFAAEYVWLLRLAPDRGRHVRTNVLDLLVVVLPMLRPFRALRALRLLTVVVRSWRQVNGALQHRGLGRIVSAIGALIIVGGVVAFALEPETFADVGDAIWWVLVTSTTVGYGDFVPVTGSARVVAAVVMVLGVALVGIITANLVDFLSSQPQVATDSTTPDPDADDAGCPHCRDATQRLARVEAQLAEVLTRLPMRPPPGDPTAGLR